MRDEASDIGDVALVQRMASGDGDALGQLYDRYATVLLAIGLRILGERQGAEDLVHDVFMEAWRKSAAYDPSRASVRTWLILRCRSRALDRRSAAPRTRTVSIETVTGLDPASPAPTAETNDADRVRAALDALPDAQRQVLELAFFAGLSSTEIAAQVGAPVGTVKSRTRLGLHALRGALGVAS